ncbi:UDP-2-acetamido-2,6-beta-L-arabino-hexul-4-ose reductase [Sporobacter termitidis DSM 10068]|uniref:UDP-2-acetamido-2,6-beta-L-arabino-hexul-4-ose reductase n=1 Tax=Sporobacter termitidis DSM 10068 TaxID=1123282 RepID=A0A1M5U9K7_9FIRM|nr:NAD-dependent epimerase/dehydratase family protein [Sporobacter termitidis]SHH59684.1 UDP-2-acetamido-2,6-beta-L-arabino-hexul-4-ose reductase [Sporobacter termitidis DSM 10068]
MKILITGAGGFIGKNLCAHLRNLGYTDLLEYTRETDRGLLEEFTKDCAFVFHLAGVNRPGTPAEFEENHVFTSELLQCLKEHENRAPVLMTSSAQAACDNPYGVSKRKAEILLRNYSEETGADVYIYRLPGVFGKWCRPNYNSVVATFCSAAANDLPLTVNDPEAGIELAYIDDVVEEFTRALRGGVKKAGNFCVLDKTYTIKVGALKDRILSFREESCRLFVPDMCDPLTSKLYSTYLSYLPEDNFSYPLTVHADNRGFFAEFLKSAGGGQVAVNLIKPGIVKGNHWHHSKTEKMLVVSGTGHILFRRLDDESLTVYQVSGENPTVIDVPPGYVHAVMNTGVVDLIMVIWANQIFDPQNPDTFKAGIDE